MIRLPKQAFVAVLVYGFVSAIVNVASLRDAVAQEMAPATTLGEFAEDSPAVSPVLDEAIVCGSCCTPCCPNQVWVNALFLSRSSKGGEYYFPPKGQWRRTWDDYETAWGPSVGITFCPNACKPCTRVGVEFYAVDDWSSTHQVAGNISVQFPSLPYLPELTQPGNPDSGYGVATFNYSSNLYNTELNVYHQNTCWLTMLAGFRWIEIGEEYGAVFQTGNTAPFYHINVNNHLYGAQLGGLVNFGSRGPWRVDGWLKTGLYGNSADQDTTEDYTSAGGQRISAAARSADVAFAADMGISLARQVTERLSFRCSYMALWIEGIALAPEQLDNTDPSSAWATLDLSHGTFYHGGFLGGEFVW